MLYTTNLPPSTLSVLPHNSQEALARRAILPAHQHSPPSPFSCFVLEEQIDGSADVA